MAAIIWKEATSGSWNTAADWNPAKVPGTDDDATISVAGVYTVSLTSPITVHSITIGDGNALLSITAPGATVTAGLTNGGTVDQTGATAVTLGSLTNNGMFEVADNASGLGDAGGGRLTVLGKLTNNGDLNIGNSGLTKAETVKAASFANTPQGTVNLVGGGAAGPATLTIGAAAPTTLTGAYYLQGNALIDFGSGHIATIASNSVLRLDGARSRVASGGSTGSSSALSSLATNNGIFELEDHTSVATSAKTFTNFGEIDVDTLDAGGSRLTIAGTLNNIGDLDIGGSSLFVGGAPALVTVGGLTGSGGIELDGGPGRATLDVLGAAFPTVTSKIILDGDALLEFGSGSIAAIAEGGDLQLDGPGAHVALSSATTTSGALARLASNSGELLLADGAAVATTVGFVNNGSLIVDTFGGLLNDGGSSLAIGGTLTNNETLDIGNDNITAAANVSVNGFVNSGVIQLTGSDNAQASLKINAAAPSALTAGSYELSGDALLQFASGGITAIGTGVTLQLEGAKSRVATASSPNSNSALTGLASNAGTFKLGAGAAVSITKSLTNTSALEIDTRFLGDGGSTLSVGGTLTNTGGLDIGTENIDAATNVTAAKLVNTGTIDILGGGKIQASLIAKSAAPGTITNATYNLTGNALLAFASGAITAIGANGQLSLNFAKARVASGSSTVSNSALTQLASNSGLFILENGAAVTTTQGFANSGTVQIDAFSSEAGGSSLTIGGTLTNSSNFSFGNSGITAADTVTAKALVNTSTITLTGGTARATLNIGAAAPGTLTGAFSVAGNALLEFNSGAITAIGSGARLTLSGKNAFVAVKASPTTNSALTTLASNDGVFSLEQGAKLATKVGLTNTASFNVDDTGPFGVLSGGSSLTVGGSFTNSATVTIGNTSLGANTSVVTTGALTNNASATFTLASGTAHASLTVGGGLTNAGFLALDEFSGFNNGGGGGSLTVKGVLTNSGTVELGNNQFNLTRATTATVAGLANTDAGTIDLFGGIAANGGSAGASLVVGAAAPSVWTGTAALVGNSLLEFTDGSIQTIANGASLSLNGAQAVVADKAKPTSNSALGGLTTNSGTLSLLNGAVVAAGALTNNGTVNLTGATGQAALKLASPAPATLAGTYNLQGNALLQFASGGITTIGGSLILTGAQARVASSSNPTSNSALTGLTTVAGTLDLEGGAVFTLAGGLTNTGGLDVDTNFENGGSSLKIAGPLGTSGFFDIGNSELTAPTKVTVSALTNTGSIGVNGGTGTNTNTASLFLTGASSDAGTMTIGGGGVLALGSTLTVTNTLELNGGTVSGGTLAGAGNIEGFGQNDTLDHVTIAAGATYTQFGGTLSDNSVIVNGAMTGGGSATLDFLNHGTDKMTNVSGFPTIGLGNGGANSLSLTDTNFNGTAGVITIADGDSGNTVDAHTLSSINAISVTAGIAADKLTGGNGGDVFTAGGETTMTGNAGANQFRFLAPGNSNFITDFKVSASNELVFSNAGFNLGQSGANATPQALPSSLFTQNATGKFTNTSQRLLYDTTNHEIFASADGSGGTSHLVATLVDHPSSIAGQLFFIT